MRNIWKMAAALGLAASAGLADGGEWTADDRVVRTDAHDKNYQIRVYNDCAKEVRLYVRHLLPWGKWKATGWYSFDPGENYYLASDDVRITHDFNERNLGIYAEQVDGWGDYDNGNDIYDGWEHVIQVRDNLFLNGRGARYRLMEDQTAELRLTCQDRQS